MPIFQLLPSIAILFLLGIFSVTALKTSFLCLPRKEFKRLLTTAGNFFFYQLLSHRLFTKDEDRSLAVSLFLAQQIVRFSYAISVTLLAWEWGTPHLTLPLAFACYLLAEGGGRTIGLHSSPRLLLWTGPFISCLLTLLLPLTWSLISLFPSLARPFSREGGDEPTQETKQEIIDMIEESQLEEGLEPHDKKLIESVMDFKHRIAREVMVPRVDIFSLPYDTTIEEAAALLCGEGYSRTPVYRDSLDNIIGVLMYKDVLAKYREFATERHEEVLKQPISTLVKSVLYVPESKKISQLLQEFRKQQVHLAIIVDEYGGTEGMVTIEDILEEIVGDIADEYDREESLFSPLPEGGWLVDARMPISALSEHLGIEIAPAGDYDTLGGYVFHETGMIPPKGHVIYTPHLKIEVMRSDDRRVEMLRLTLLPDLSESSSDTSEPLNPLSSK